MHLNARIVRGTNADDAYSAEIFRLRKAPRAAVGGIVGRAAAKDRNIVVGRECLGHGLDHFCRRGSVGRVVEIQQQDTHVVIVQDD